VRAIRPIWGLASDASEVADSPDFAVARTFDRNPNQGVNDVTKRELSQELQTAGFLLDEGPTGRFRILDLRAGDHLPTLDKRPDPYPYRLDVVSEWWERRQHEEPITVVSSRATSMTI